MDEEVSESIQTLKTLTNRSLLVQSILFSVEIRSNLVFKYTAEGVSLTVEIPVANSLITCLCLSNMMLFFLYLLFLITCKEDEVGYGL